tara:strand:- start:1996 stop:2208 length:213 start_codon:yes stop_codon:yes gene_type:complete
MSEKVHTLSITGMTCGCCSGRVTRALEATPGVLKAFISFEDNNGNILTTPDISSSNLVDIVKSVGFEASA